MDELQKIIDRMAPDAALASLAEAAKKLLVYLDEQARIDFVVSMIGEAGRDKVASLVDL